MRILLVFTLLCSVGCAGVSESRARLAGKPAVLSLGDASIEVVIHQGRAGGPTVINLHDDENTSVHAAHRVLYEGGGRLIELRHTGERNLHFRLDGVAYAVDPNRMFTARGIELSLRKLGAHSEGALREVAALAARLVEIYALGELSTVITVHNNTDDNFTVHSFAEGGEYAYEAAAVRIVEERDPDDFFFVTDREIFDAPALAGFNVVLQDNTAVTDDGSLSVLCARRGLPYVNIEAQHGHLEEQVIMLRTLLRILPAQI